VWTVAALLAHVRDVLEGEYASVVVEGEVGEVTVARSGHVYFALSDDGGDASLRAVMWRSRYARRPCDLEKGLRVRLRGKLTLYPARGAFQMDVVAFTEAGEGRLVRIFRETVARLEAEGLTDPARKRRLPLLPRRVGIVTSPTGAALRDVLRVLDRRFPVPVLVSGARVQGERAPASLVAALARIAAVPDVDVVIVGRGGGSAEDLAAFNDETLARAVAAHPVPVISAVGHEVDVSVVDLVADRRAATPSEAAELAVPERVEVDQRLATITRQLGRAVHSHLVTGRNRLLTLDGRLPRPDRILMDRRLALDDLFDRMSRAGPQERIVQGRHDVAMIVQRCRTATGDRLQRARGSLAASAAALEALSPLGVLGRGYAVVTRSRDGALVRAARDVRAGDEVDVCLERGRLGCTVDATREGE
jgi:exodeoxyribonuclease VII large subunit